MLQSRREIIEELLDFVGETGDANAVTTAQRLINRVVMRLWNRHPWQQFLAQNPYTFATVANQQSYPLPTRFGRPLPDEVARNLTTGREVAWRAGMDLLRDDPAAGTTLESTGEPDHYWTGGTSGVAVQPTVATAYELVSDNNADIDVLVTLLGLDANGNEQRLQYTLNGTTAVACGTWTYVEEFSKAFPNTESVPLLGTSSRGNVTLRIAGAGATADTLTLDESARNHVLVNLYRVPSGVWTIALPYVRAPKRLLYDSDEIPFGWGPAVFGDMHREWLVNQGNMTRAEADAASLTSPDFLDLLSADVRARKRPHVKPYRRP